MSSAVFRRSVLAVACVMALAPASAWSAWLPTTTVGGTTLAPQGATPVVASGPDGRGVTAWRTGAPGGGPTDFRLLISPFDAGGSGAPVQIGPDGPIGAPQVAAGHDGTRAVVWARSGEGVRAVVIAPDGTVGPVRDIAGAGTSAPLVDVDAGRVTVVYLRTADGATGVEFVRFVPGGPVSAPLSLTAPNPIQPQPISDLRLAREPGGTIAAVWRHRIDSEPATARYQVRVAQILPIGTTVVGQGISDPLRNAGQAAVAPGSGGFRIVWPERPAGPVVGGEWSVYLGVAPVGGIPMSGAEMVPDGPSQNIVDIATLPSGTSLVLHSVPLADGSLRGRIIAPDGTLAPGAPPPPIPPGGGIPSMDGFGLAAGADGLFTLAWADSLTGETALRARRLDALGIPQAVTDLDPPDATDPRLALTAAGSVTAVWLREPGSGDRQVRSAHFDIEGPVLSLSAPGPVAAGQPVTLTATARDRAQPITYLWSLGDGSPAFSARASVAPVYGRPGDYPVQVTATDSLGRATVASTTVTVVPPAPAGAPLVCAPPQPPVIAPGPVRITLTVAQLRINQRISQAAVRRVAALQARADGRPAPQAPPRAAPGRITLTVAQLRINQRISQAALRRVNALSARVQGLPQPAPAGGTPGRLALGTGQLLTNQRIAQAAVRRVNALAACLDAAGR